MPSIVVLDNADIGLWGDFQATRIVIPHLQVLSPSESFEQTYIRFEGDQRKTGFRGEGDDAVFQMTARYATGEHADAAELVELFRTAHLDDADGRLMLRTHVGEVGGLNDLEAVMVPTFTRPFAAGRYLDVSFTAQAVAYTLEV